MNNNDMELSERSGVWYFRGEPLRIGSQVAIDGVLWHVLRVDRARSESQEPYMWIRNEWYGTTVYAPSWIENKPQIKLCLKEELLGRRLTAA